MKKYLFQNMFSKWTIGILFIFIVTVIWSFSSYMAQFIYSDLDFHSPFLLTYIASSLFAIYIPVWYFYVFMGWVKDPPFWFNDIIIDKEEDDIGDSIVKIEQNSLLTNKSSSSSDSENSPIIASPSLKVTEMQVKNLFFSNMLEPIPKNYCHMHIIQTALLLTPLWFIANCFYNYALYLTSIGSSTVISTLSGVFTLFFSWKFGIEIVTKGKIIGLVICILGVIFVTYADDKGNEDGQHSFTGDLIVLLGALHIILISLSIYYYYR
jgi:solute carrier family 35 protein F5